MLLLCISIVRQPIEYTVKSEPRFNDPYLMLYAIFIMQQTLAKVKDSQELSENYESISSEQQLNYTREEVAFPSMPAQFANIYKIYCQSTQRISKLQQKVTELEEKILMLERCKSDKNIEEIDVQFLQDNNQESQFMAKYRYKCEKRQKELQSLVQIYSGLKRLNSQVNIFRDPRIAAAITKYIKSHRKVVAYKCISNYILVLCRQVHHRRKHNINFTINRTGSQSSNKKQKKNRSRDEGEQVEQKEEISFTLRLVNTHNFIHTLKPKPMPYLEGVFDAIQLQEIKLNSEKEVNIVKINKMHSKKDLLLATYSEDQQIFILLDINKRILVTDIEENNKSYAQLDKSDDIILMEVRKNELWVGTTEGVLRVYSIENGNIRLTALFGCFYKETHSTSSYLLIGQLKVQRVVFSMHNNLYELNMANYTTKHVCEIAENIHYTIGNYLISDGQISKVTVVKEKYQISRNQRLNKWYDQYRAKNKEQKILYICEKEKELQLILGDTKGQLQLISL